MKGKLRKTFADTIFEGAPVFSVSALDAATLEPLINFLLADIAPPERSSNDSFLMAIDHCFNIKGQGSVFTGTVLSGSIKVGEASGAMNDGFSCANACFYRALKSQC